jgi:hypothetical protein
VLSVRFSLREKLLGVVAFDGGYLHDRRHFSVSHNGHLVMSNTQ